MTIHQIHYKDIVIDIALNKSQIDWSFEFNKQKYGNAVILEDSKKNTLIGKLSLMVLNAVETYEKLIEKK